MTCSLVLHPPPPTSGPSGITLKWSSAFTHTSGDTCSQQSWSTRAPSQIKIYDGLTPYAPLLAMQNLSGWEGSTEWGCDVKVTVSTSGRSLLLETTMMAPAAAVAGWTARWGQAEGECGNSICEPSVGEYGDCTEDCSDDTLPHIDLTWQAPALVVAPALPGTRDANPPARPSRLSPSTCQPDRTFPRGAG